MSPRKAEIKYKYKYKYKFQRTCSMPCDAERCMQIVWISSARLQSAVFHAVHNPVHLIGRTRRSVP